MTSAWWHWNNVDHILQNKRLNTIRFLKWTSHSYILVQPGRRWGRNCVLKFIVQNKLTYKWKKSPIQQSHTWRVTHNTVTLDINLENVRLSFYTRRKIKSDIHAVVSCSAPNCSLKASSCSGLLKWKKKMTNATTWTLSNTIHALLLLIQPLPLMPPLPASGHLSGALVPIVLDPVTDVPDGWMFILKVDT